MTTQNDPPQEKASELPRTTSLAMKMKRMMCTLQSFQAGMTLVEWDESQIMCHGEEQASENVLKPKPDVVQVGPNPNGRR